MRTSIAKLNINFLELITGMGDLEDVTKMGTKITLGFDGGGLKVCYHTICAV